MLLHETNIYAQNFQIQILIVHSKFTPVSITKQISNNTPNCYSGLFLNIFPQGWTKTNSVAPWCTGYDYCTTSFNKAWTQVLRRFKSYLSRFGDSRWPGSLRTIPAGSKAKHISSVNNTTKQFIIIIIIIIIIISNNCHEISNPSCLTNIKLKLDFIVFLKYLNSFSEKTSFSEK